MTKEPIVPTLDITLSDAVEELTGTEVRTIQQHYREKLEHLGALELTVGAVYIYECRSGTKPGWGAVEGRTMRELNGYFTPEPDDVDEDDPDSDVGKGDASGG